jgi:hypothetical protein
MTGILETLSTDVLGALASLVLVLVAYFTKKYLVPMLNTDGKKKMAEYALILADDITDQLRARYPDKPLIELLNRIIDTIMESCGITNRETAKRIAEAALERRRLREVKTRS